MTALSRDNLARARRPAGMTLVEAVISVAIVGAMLAAALSVMGSTARARHVQSVQCVGANLARHLMAEVLQSRYREPVASPRFGREPPERSGCRETWDDVDDYHGWRACPPQAKDGTALAFAAGWAREVTVEYVLPANPTTPTGTDKGLKRVTVTAISPGGKRTTLQALRSEKSLCDQVPEAKTTYVSSVGVELQLGPDPAARVASGTHLLSPVSVSEQPSKRRPARGRTR